MCLIAAALRVHPVYPLVLAANRDEAHARPTAAADWQPDAPDVFGGWDLVGGGGWLQVARSGRLAAVTNVRLGLGGTAAPCSRGTLVAEFVRGQAPSMQSARLLQTKAATYGPFNVLLWDGDALAFATNAPGFATTVLAPGLHAVSNGPLEDPWPKMTSATRALAGWLGDGPPDAPEGGPDAAALFRALADTRTAPDATLPDTGVGLALERRLSPVFIEDAIYGTRASTVVAIAHDHLWFEEHRFGPSARIAGVTRLRIDFAGA